MAVALTMSGVVLGAITVYATFDFPGLFGYVLGVIVGILFSVVIRSV